MQETKRVLKLRNEIIKAIPKFPNNKETKTQLESMHLTDLLIHYLSWMSRCISIKPRKIVIEPAVTNDRRYNLLKSNMNSLFKKVGKGENLTPHLSLQALSRGYTPEASKKEPGVDRWADKDFLLNVMGYHHFHLGTRIEAKGHVERSDDVLFARVSREEFTAIGLFNHEVFEPIGENMSPERKRLWEIFDECTLCDTPLGSVVISSPIATSGHPIHLVSTAQEYSWVIREVDPKLDDHKYIAELYSGAGAEVPKKPKLEWALNFSDLGLHEKNYNYFLVLRRGFN